MKADQAELAARVEMETERVVRELLAEAQSREDLTLSDIECLVRAAGQQFMERLTARLVEAQAQAEKENLCPECGQKMQAKGRKKRQLITETGEVELTRGYYYCPRCRKGFFPPGPTVGPE